MYMETAGCEAEGRSGASGVKQSILARLYLPVCVALVFYLKQNPVDVNPGPLAPDVVMNGWLASAQWQVNPSCCPLRFRTTPFPEYNPY